MYTIILAFVNFSLLTYNVIIVNIKEDTDCQQTHEKMLNITNHQRNANQNYNEVSPHTGQNGHHQKNLQTINAGEGVEKREPSCTVPWNVN